MIANGLLSLLYVETVGSIDVDPSNVAYIAPLIT